MIPWLKYRKAERKLILMIYISVLSVGTVNFLIPNAANIIGQMKSVRIVWCIGMVFAAAVIYAADFMMLNMVKNKALILDFKFYFSGRQNWNAFLAAAGIGVMEEMVFRLPLAGNLSGPYRYLFLLVNSVSFGAVHLFFSKYDGVSKTILGFILGTICISENNIFYPVILHTAYDFWVLKEKDNKGEGK